jgi:uncharacterized membrane protein YraQ (UPF0718 family)
MKERTKLVWILAIFAVCYFLPTGHPRFTGAVAESLALVRWYAREHVLLCLVPAFFIAGAIGVFLSQGAVMRYLGSRARAVIAYPVAAVSGSILAVCSCTVLPLFAGIYTRGAGLGPATAFLYSGPAINVLAIILTARVLGFGLGLARALGAVLFAVVIGLLMQLIFSREERARGAAAAPAMPEQTGERGLRHNALLFASMIGVLVFANWGRPQEAGGFFATVHAAKWVLTGLCLLGLAAMLLAWFRRAELAEWVSESWGFAVQILPLLLAGVLVAGLLLGGPGGSERGLIPSRWIAHLVGGNGLSANLFASVAGALMYFATLTEVPILDGLLHGGMGQGPALALLLAGPAVSLPNLLVIRSVLGTRKTLVYLLLVVGMSTAAGLIYGNLFGAGTTPQ